MEVKKSVFGSKHEYKLYKKLKSTWSEKYDIYLSLPFANIIDLEDARVSGKERDFLFKTSVDFTLCEKDAGKPIMSIDFDGIGRGFSRDDRYILPSIKSVGGPKDLYRKLKFDLKLRIAQEVGYPYVIVASEEAEPFSEDLELTIVDGIVGHFLSGRHYERLARERNGELTQEGFEAWKERHGKYKEWSLRGPNGTLIKRYKREHTVDDYILAESIRLKVEADFESNPISRTAMTLLGQVMSKLSIGPACFTLSPDLLSAKLPSELGDLVDSETLNAINKRKKELENGSLVGYQITFEIEDSSKKITSRVFIRNFGPGSYQLAEEIATILAAKKALVWWLSEGKGENSTVDDQARKRFSN